MASDDEVVTLLQSIDRRLAVLTASQERDIQIALRDELLRTPARIAMFSGIDGVRTSPELAKLGNVSNRAAQLFVKELLDLGIVRAVPTDNARTVIVERDGVAIVQWYTQRTVSG